MLKESKADIFVDPVLHTACALDLKHHCAAITPGRGRRGCLLDNISILMRLTRKVRKVNTDCVTVCCFLSPSRDVVSVGGAAGQESPSAARVQEETSGPHRHVGLRCQGAQPTLSRLRAYCVFTLL